MHRGVLFLIAIITINGLSADTLQRLRRTKELNFTFYYEHVYPEPQQLQISLEFSMTTSNLSLGMETLNTSFNAISTLAKKYNATFVQDPIEEREIESVQIQIVNKYSIDSLFLLSIAPQITMMNDFLGELVNLDEAYHTKLAFIEWASYKELDQMTEEAKALAGATQRSKEICEKYLNMKLKKIFIFEKYVPSQEANGTLEQEQGFVGSFPQVVSQAEEQQLDQSAVPVNQIYLCQIICQNNIHFDYTAPSSKKINSKLAQKKASQKQPPPQQKQKNTKTSSKPLEKGKSINPDKYQRNRQDQL